MIAIGLALAILLVPQSLWSQQEIRGFPRSVLSVQAEREAFVRSIPNPDTLKLQMERLTERPHMAGTPESREVAEMILARWRSYGLDAWLEVFEGLMPFREFQNLELLGPERHIAVIREPALPEVPATLHPRHVDPFLGFSADGDVMGEVVYANYGQLADYRLLDSLGVDLTGKIVLARTGGMPQPKWRLAAERGAVGLISYHDPREAGYYHGDTYPEGPRRPDFAISSAAILGWDVYSGDPLTPGWASEPGARRLPLSEATSLVPIPVVPISSRDALPFLRNLDGPVAPASWRGALPVTYRIGRGGPARARITVRSDWQTRPVYNVVARIPGEISQDQWVLFGNHHDALGPGADDPISGLVALDEAARALSTLHRTGWRPARSIYFMAWDGHEWGLFGSTEWAEKHAERLKANAVAYINTDNVQRGWIRSQGPPSLRTFVAELARDIHDGEKDMSVLEAWQAGPGSMVPGAPGRQASDASERPSFRLGPIGMNTDYAPFILHLGVPALHLAYSGQTGPLWARHSNYETFDYYSRFLDPTFGGAALLAQTLATAALRLADAPVLPFEFQHAASLWTRYIDDIEAAARRDARLQGLDLDDVRTALGELARASSGFESAYLGVIDLTESEVRQRWAALETVNRLLFTAEQLLTDPDGIPGREWNRHLVQGTTLYSASGVASFPALRIVVEERPALPLARREADRLAAALRRYARRIDEVAAGLTTVLR